MTAAGLAAGTVTARFNSMRAVFRAAHRDKVIGSDPTDERHASAETAGRDRHDDPHPGDVGTIMAAAEV